MTCQRQESQSSSRALAHGIPDDQAPFLHDLLDEALRLHRLGRAPADVRRAVLRLNSNLPHPLPSYSAGGLAECIDAVLAKEPEVAS
jgi:hypothetical protein